MTTTEQRVSAIDYTLHLAETACGKECTPVYELQLTRGRYNRLQSKIQILHKLLGKQRAKRGLANFIGDISKTLFGTLSEKDLEQINNEFDNIYKDNKQLAQVLTNHTKILKIILDSSSTDYKNLRGKINAESNALRNLGTGVNANTLNTFVNSKLMLATLLIDEMVDDINTAINAINDGKHGVVHPQILTPKILKSAIGEFEENHRTRHHFDNDESNYQHLIDISKLTVAVVQGLFTYILDIPVLEKEEGLLKHIIPIPEKTASVFLSIIPDHEYVIHYRDSYVPIDKITIEKCKTISEYLICKPNQPNIKLSESENCEASLLRRYVTPTCNLSPYLLHKETFIPTNDGYIIIPTVDIDLDIVCEGHVKNIIVKTNTLISGENCQLYNGYDKLDLPRHLESKQTYTINVTYDIKYEHQDLDKLKGKLIQLPKQINVDELRRARLSLDDTQNILDRISTHRRIKTWKETSLEWIQYLGYISIACIVLFVLYKSGILSTLSDCIPKKICFLCIKNKNEVQPHVVTYAASARPLLETVETGIKIKPRRVKL